MSAKNLYYAVLVILFAACQQAMAGTDAAAFLKAGVGARALSMGSAFVSVCDDSTAMYWNPAGLARIKRLSLTAMSQSLGSTKWDSQKDIAPKYQYMGLTFPVEFALLGKNTFGVGMINSGLEKVTYSYLDASGRIVRDNFEDIENAYLFSWGLPLPATNESIFAGVTLKYITQKFTKITDAEASGYDMDFGLLYIINNTRIGLLVERGAEMTWANGRKDTAGAMTKLGASNKFGLSKYLSLMASLDAVQRKNEPLAANLGGEFGFEKEIGNENTVLFEGIFTRFGVEGYAVEDRNNSASKINGNLNLNMGLGLDFLLWGYYLQLDYAMSTYTLGDKNRVSLTLYF